MRHLRNLHLSSFFARNKPFGVVYLGGTLIALHYYLIIYVNSSFLDKFFTHAEVSLLYAAGSAVSLLALFFSHRLLRKVSELSLLRTVLTIEAVGTLGMLAASSALAAGLSFLMHQAAIGLILYLFDIFIESKMSDEGRTGEVRGIFLTLANTVLVLSPLLAGILAGMNGGSFVFVYGISFLALLFVFFLHPETGHIKVGSPKRAKLSDMPKTVRLGMLLQFILNFFYSWMVVWSPIYLLQVVGLPWEAVGIIFAVMLIPFALFELPLGELADRVLGEKEIMITGFFIAGIATISLSLITSASVAVWALALFATRAGASAVEIASESYFFKHVSGHDTGVVALFRSVRPLSFIIAPFAGSLAIALFSFPMSFAVVGSALMLGGLLAFGIVDTK